MPRCGVDHQFVESGSAVAAIKDGDRWVFGTVGWVGTWHAFIVAWICDLDAFDVVCAEAHGLLWKRALHFVVTEIRNVEKGQRDEILGNGRCTHTFGAGDYWEFDSAENKYLALVGQDAHAAYAVVLSRQPMNTRWVHT